MAERLLRSRSVEVAFFIAYHMMLGYNVPAGSVLRCRPTTAAGLMAAKDCKECRSMSGSTDEQGEKTTSDRVDLDSEFTVEQFEIALSHKNVSDKCNLCGDNSWFYHREKPKSNILRWGYLRVEGEEKNSYGLSYYTRACLNCGNIQSFGRVSVQNAYKSFKSSEEADG